MEKNRRNKGSVPVVNGGTVKVYLLFFGLTGHLLDPAEGSEVAGGGCLLEQLMGKRERERKRKRDKAEKEKREKQSALGGLRETYRVKCDPLLNKHQK